MFPPSPPLRSLPPEGRRSTAEPDRTWPSQGHVVFSKVTMRYRDNTPTVFRDLSFEIKPRCKIGVVGRTGAGKSSLGACLFRLVELESGSISIDDQNIAEVSLERLRSSLSVIPQDPVLFSGTVRYNLDPFDEHDDLTIWSALESIHMKDKITALSNGLSARVAENGENFSVGERQLLCMVRAVLRGAKILLLDEATANVDTELDALIQKSLREAFHHCTLIIIAHRLSSVLWCDQVLVLEDGGVCRYDAPSVLMREPAFREMMTAGT